MSTPTLRPGHNRALTRTENEFLEQLRFRQHQSDGAQGAFLSALTPRRQTLIVRTMMHTYEIHPGMTKNQSTLDGLEAAGLIKIGPGQKLPAPFAPGGYGRPITITQLGRDTIG